MKRKIFLTILMGILFIYPIDPFLHETGHALMVLLMRGKIESFLLYPQPCVIFNARGLSTIQIYLITISGTIFPCLLALLPLGKTFFGKLCALYLRAQGIVTCIPSLSLLLFPNSDPAVHKDDVMRALNLYDNKGILIIIYFVLLFLQVFLIGVMIRKHIDGVLAEEGSKIPVASNST